MKSNGRDVPAIFPGRCEIGQALFNIVLLDEDPAECIHNLRTIRGQLVGAFCIIQRTFRLTVQVSPGKIVKRDNTIRIRLQGFLILLDGLAVIGCLLMHTCQEEVGRRVFRVLRKPVIHRFQCLLLLASLAVSLCEFYHDDTGLGLFKCLAVELDGLFWSLVDRFDVTFQDKPICLVFFILYKNVDDLVGIVIFFLPDG